MKRRLIAFVFSFLMLASLCACGSKEETFSFEELKGNRFVFASGAGAWSTELTIGADGSFKGKYHDSEMGSIGPGYPNGTRYYSEFSGKFVNPEKVNEYTCKVTVAEIEYANEVNTEEILDEVLYHYSEAQGIAGAEEILIYLPGAPISELPEDYVFWARSSAYMEEGITELPFYGLYNEVQQCGFSSYNVVESLKIRIGFTEEQALAIETSIQNDPLTQLEYNEKSALLYQIWDSDLNAIWSELKNTLDEEAFEQVLAEQREWIKTKEAAVKEAGAEYEGGSMQPMVMSLKAAELTKIRVYELLEYLGE